MEQIHKNHSIGYIKAYGNFGELYGEVKVNNNSVEFSTKTSSSHPVQRNLKMVCTCAVMR